MVGAKLNVHKLLIKPTPDQTNHVSGVVYVASFEQSLLASMGPRAPPTTVACHGHASLGKAMPTIGLCKHKVQLQTQVQTPLVLLPVNAAKRAETWRTKGNIKYQGISGSKCKTLSQASLNY